MKYIIQILFFCVNINHFGVCSFSRPVDLTWPFENATIYWPNARDFHFTNQITSGTGDEFWYAMNDFCAGEHGGTHLDAPYHFHKSGWKVGNIPLERLIAKGIVVDISKEVETVGVSRNLEESDLISWEKENGSIQNNTVVLIKFGWSKYYAIKNDYLGINREGNFNFPAISAAAAHWLALNKNVVGVGLDVASVDPGSNTKYDAHRSLAIANIYNLENVKLVEKLPVRNFTLLVMPMHIAEGTGAPCRIIAFLENVV